MDDKKSLDLNTSLASQLKQMTAAEWTEQAVNDYLHCYLCGAKLKFSHQTDFATLVVAEEAHCLNCQIRTKKVEHHLH